MRKKCYKRRRGMVYAMTNAADNNEVIAFRRGIDGELFRENTYATGGSGTGVPVVDPLQSQGSLILSPDGCFLFAVNAGSDSISSFRVDEHGDLTLADVEPSGGFMPNSLAVYRHLLYVTNVGDPANQIDSNVVGFRVERDGRLTPISGATSALSTPDAQPASVVFSPDGKLLAVTELSNNRISVFQVNRDGTLTGPIVNESSGDGPFGAEYLSTGVLLVSEAGANALSSYFANEEGILNVISASVQNGQTAVCWVVASINERFAFTSNTGSGTITTYHINDNGSLELQSIVYSTLEGIAAPIDSGVSSDGCNYYVLNGDQGTISVFAIERKGRLIRIQVVEDTGLPTVGAQGLAVL